MSRNRVRLNVPVKRKKFVRPVVFVKKSASLKQK